MKLDWLFFFQRSQPHSNNGTIHPGKVGSVPTGEPATGMKWQTKLKNNPAVSSMIYPTEKI